MAILSNESRNASCNFETDEVNSGTIELLSAGDAVLAIVALHTTAFLAPNTAGAGVGQAYLIGDDDTNAVSPSNPRSGVGETAAGAGTVCTKWRMKDSGGDIRYSGNAGATGSGKEVILANTTIADDQPVEVTGASWTVGAGSSA